MKKVTMAMIKKGTITEQELAEIFGGVIQKMEEAFDGCENIDDAVSKLKGRLDPEKEEDKKLLIMFGCLLDGAFKNLTTPAAYKWFIEQMK